MSRLPPLPNLIAFDAAARLGSFVRAAEELRLTPSAISHRIRTLEDSLGQALFSRAKRRIALTDAGARYHAQIRAGLALIEEATRALGRPAGGEPRLLKISVAPAIGSKWLVARLAEYQQGHPQLEFAISVSTSLEPLLDGSAELGLRYGGPPWQGLVARKLSNEELAPVCAPGIAARLGNPPEPAALAGMRLLRHPLLPWRPWFEAAGLDWPEPDSGPVFDDAMMMLEAAAAGAGIAMSVGLPARAFLAGGTLVHPFAIRCPGRGFYAVMSPAAAQQPCLRTFVEWLQQAARRPAPGAPASLTSGPASAAGRSPDSSSPANPAS